MGGKDEMMLSPDLVREAAPLLLDSQRLPDCVQDADDDQDGLGIRCAAPLPHAPAAAPSLPAPLPCPVPRAPRPAPRAPPLSFAPPRPFPGECPAGTRSVALRALR